MTLNEYLQLDGALSVCELRKRMADLGSPIKSDAQIRQWQHRYADRIPSPVNCVAIEQATEGQVTRKDLRPHDWRPDFMRSNPAFPAWMARERWNLAPQLASVRAPSLLLWGDADAISPVAVGERLQGLLPCARLQVLPGGAHDLAQTHAEAVAGHISRHLQAGAETA